MLYMTGHDSEGKEIKIVVLETVNLEEIRKGRPAKTPDGSVVIAWTADIVWLADKLADSGGDPAVIAGLIDQAAKRPEKPTPRKKHETHVQKFIKRDL